MIVMLKAVDGVRKTSDFSFLGVSHHRSSQTKQTENQFCNGIGDTHLHHFAHETERKGPQLVPLLRKLVSRNRPTLGNPSRTWKRHLCDPCDK